MSAERFRWNSSIIIVPLGPNVYIDVVYKVVMEITIGHENVSLESRAPMGVVVHDAL
jgi:hypothetical protein